MRVIRKRQSNGRETVSTHMRTRQSDMCVPWFNSKHVHKFLLFTGLFISVSIPLYSSDVTKEVNVVFDDAIYSHDQTNRSRLVYQQLLIHRIVPERYHYFFREWQFDYRPEILVGIIQHESRWTHNAVGGINRDGTIDLGIAQLNSRYLRYFAARYLPDVVFDVFNPHHSLIVASRHLNWLYSQTQSERGMVMAYNIGLTAYRNSDRMESATRYYNSVIREIELWRF